MHSGAPVNSHNMFSEKGMVYGFWAVIHNVSYWEMRKKENW